MQAWYVLKCKFNVPDVRENSDDLLVWYHNYYEAQGMLTATCNG